MGPDLVTMLVTRAIGLVAEVVATLALKLI
jgi:hypothetical protein